jgi:hypothetical protein
MKTIGCLNFFQKPKTRALFQFEKKNPKDKNLDYGICQKKKNSGTPRFFDFRTRGYYYITKSKNHTTLVKPHPGNLLCKGWILYVSR